LAINADPNTGRSSLLASSSGPVLSVDPVPHTEPPASFTSSYRLLDSMLMSPHVSPYTARTTLNPLMVVPTNDIHAPPSGNITRNHLPTISPTSEKLTRGAYLLPCENTQSNSRCQYAVKLTRGAYLLPCENMQSNSRCRYAVISQPQVTSPPPASSSSTTYTFQTCMAHQQDADPAWDGFTDSQCFRQSSTNPIAIQALHSQQCSPLAAILPNLHVHDDLRCIHAPQSVAREDVPCNITNALFDETTSCDVDMARIVYRLQDDGDSDNDVVSIVLMIDSTADGVSMIDSTIDDMEKGNANLDDIVSMINSTADGISMIDLTVDDMEKSDDDLDDVVSMIDCTKKIDDDHNNIVSMINHAEAVLIANNMKKNDNDLNDVIVLMINSTVGSDSSNGASMIDADAASTWNNNDLNDIVSIVLMIGSTVDDAKKNDDDFSNDEELSDYRSHYNAVKDNNVDAEVASTVNDMRNNDGDLKDIVWKIDTNATVDDMKRSDDATSYR